MRPRASIRVLQGVVGLLVLAYTVSTIVRKDNTPSPLFDGWVGNLAYGGAAILCGLRGVLERRHRLAWLTIAASLLLFTAGSVLWTTIVQFWNPVPYPSPSDVPFLVFYPVAYLGIGFLIRKSRPRAAGVWLDGLIAATGFGAIASALVIGPISAGNHGNTATVLTNLAYPLGDLVLVTMLIGYFSISGWRASGMWWALSAGYALFACADSLYVWRVIHGTYVTGTPLDSLWAIAAFVIASTAWADRPTVTDRSPAARPIALPALFLLSSLALIVYATQRPVLPVAILLASVTLLIAIGRTFLSYRHLRLLAESRREARTDELTGIANRRPFYEAVAQWANRGDGSMIGLLIIDLARFKAINDSLGHRVGDELLRQLGERLATTARQGDVVARLGGDEFGIVINPLTSEKAALRVAARVHEILAEPFMVKGASVRIDAAIGLAFGPEHATDTDSLIHRADVAMFEAKRRHLPSMVYRSEWDVDSAARLELVDQLRGAIGSDELVVHYQPKLDLHTRAISSVEALVRWHHPSRGLLVADQFIDLADQTGLMSALTRRVLDLALRQQHEWRQQGHDVRMAINLSVSSLFDATLPDAVADMLQEHRVAGTSIIFEITEHSLIFDRRAADSVLDRLRALGCELSVDDYGTGFSALSYLRDLPVAELKLDRSFIAGAANDERAKSIVRSTVDLAHALSLRMVAEGVETDADLAMLTELGCDEAQGYLIARPMAGDAMSELLGKPPTRTKTARRVSA